MIINKFKIQIKKFAFYVGAIFFVLISCAKTTRFTANGNGALSCIGKNCVAVGQYFQTGNSQGLPLAVFSDDYGVTFGTASQPTLPYDADSNGSVQLFGVTCSNERCAGIGYYNLKFDLMLFTLSARPLAVFSENSGQTFSSAMQPPLPSDVNPNYISALRGIGNSDEKFVGVGAYNVNVDLMGGGIIGSLPLVVITDDEGKSFIQSYQPSLPSDAATPKNAQLYNAHCIQKHCVAVGIYDAPTPQLQRPLVLISDDGGLSFNPVSKISILNTTDSSQNMGLRAITCNGLRCLAVGFYHQKNITGTLPLLLVSDDGGLTFSMSSESLLPEGANNALNAELKTITCQGLRCVGGGFYNFDGSTSVLAFSVFSADGGVTFTIMPSVPLPSDGDNTKGSELTGVSCLDKNCLGVGFYNFDFIPSTHPAFPLAVFSNDNKKEFVFASQPVLPIGFDPVQSNVLGDIQP